MLARLGQRLNDLRRSYVRNHNMPGWFSLANVRRTGFIITLLFCGHPCSSPAARTAQWPALPDRDSSVELPAQEWPLRPGSRTIRVLVHFPRGRLDAVNAETGLMLSLHNWGGVDCVGTADPQVLAERLNVVALCVNYVQSGQKDSITGPEPYDYGYLQGLDALRSLWWLRDRMLAGKHPFDNGRIYSTGGSGGGNVTLMANKLAPRTFTCIVDMCGMKKLSDDIAYNLEGGSRLNARWTRDAQHPYYLRADIKSCDSSAAQSTCGPCGASARRPRLSWYTASTTKCAPVPTPRKWSSSCVATASMSNHGTLERAISTAKCSRRPDTHWEIGTKSCFESPGSI